MRYEETRTFKVDPRIVKALVVPDPATWFLEDIRWEAGAIVIRLGRTVSAEEKKV